MVTPDRVVGMRRRRSGGLFEATVPLEGRAAHDYTYHFRVRGRGVVREVPDPYRFGQVLTDFDLHLLGEGTHHHAWEKLGPHRITMGGATGVHFAVWAPNAQRVSLIGDFNDWDGRVHVMRRLVPSGIWEIFIPDLADGARYKFEIRTPDGFLLQKVDPFARFFEVPPLTASVVWTAGASLGGLGVDGRTALSARVARAAGVDLRGAPRVVAPRAGRRAPRPDLS